MTKFEARELRKEDYKKVITAFIKDDELWVGGIPRRENYYINKYNITEEELAVIYDGLCKIVYGLRGW